MSGYLGNFFEHGGQIVSLATAAAVWLAMSTLGAVVGGRHRVAESTPLLGWAVISLTFTVVGVFTSLPFTYLAVGFAVLALVAGVVVIRRGEPLLPAGMLKTLVLVAPLLLLVSAMVGSQWDEFADWLMSPRQVLDLDTFPDNSNKHRGGSLAAYPYGWHFITYLASRLAGRLVENAGALINVLLLLTFGLMNVRLLYEGLGRDSSHRTPGWGMCALGGLSVTLINPTFVQKVALTSYADVASAVCVGFGGVLGWYMLGALAEGRRTEAHRLAIQIGLIMLVLVNLKQATVVLFALVVGIILLAGLRDPAVRFADLVRTIPAMVLPGVVIYAVWRYYLFTDLQSAEMTIMPFEDWNLRYLPQIIWKMVVTLSKKGAYLALMLIAVAFAVRAMIRFRTPFDRLAIMLGAAFVGYNLFLLFVFVSTFGKFDALRVASLWRYNLHLGLLGVAFASYGLAIAWRHRAPAWLRDLRLAWLPMALILAAPFVFTHKLRFDRHPPVPHFRAVGADTAKILKPGDRLFVLDPTGSGESGVIARFELRGSEIFRGYMGVFQRPSRKQFQSVFQGASYTHVLVHSVIPIMPGIAGLPLAGDMSYLLENDKGSWRIVRTWPRSDAPSKR